MNRQDFIDYDNDPYFNQSKAPKNHKSFKKPILGTMIVLGLFTGVNTAFIAKDYLDSLNWHTSRDSLKMADMPVDTLNDSGKQAQYKEDFLVLYSKALGKDGSLHANKQLMNQLKTSLAKIKTAKPLYTVRYNKVKTKYDIKVKLDSLYGSDNTITKSPDKVRSVLASIAPNVNAIYQNNNKDAFVNSELSRIHDLSDDVNSISSITNQLLTLVQIKNHMLTPNASTVPDSYDNVYRRFDSLHYHWDYFNHFASKQDKLQKILSEQLDKINYFKSYKADQDAKAQAYNDLEKKRQAHKQANDDAIAEKQREAQRAREQQEAQKRAEEQRKAQEEADRKAAREQSEREQQEAKQSSSSNNQSSSRPASRPSTNNQQSSRPNNSNSNNNSNQNNNLDNNPETSDDDHSIDPSS